MSNGANLDTTPDLETPDVGIGMREPLSLSEAEEQGRILAKRTIAIFGSDSRYGQKAAVRAYKEHVAKYVAKAGSAKTVFLKEIQDAVDMIREAQESNGVGRFTLSFSTPSNPFPPSERAIKRALKNGEPRPGNRRWKISAPKAKRKPKADPAKELRDILS